MISSLAYLINFTPSLDRWESFMTGVLAMQLVTTKHADSLTFRMDQKSQRFIVQHSPQGVGLGLGFELTGGDALLKVRKSLSEQGINVHQGTHSELDLRGVSDMIWCHDPDQNRVEFALGHRDDADPFVASRPIGGFRTGELGLGHVGLKAGKFAAMRAFYVDILQFKMSDYSTAPLRVDFLHVNQRHHTLGLADMPNQPGIYHIMIEFMDWDDVGRTMDIAMQDSNSIGVTLGRHTNDLVTSFYVMTPDQYMIEVGWGGLLIDDAQWQVKQLPGLSLWGHERHWLPEEKRKEAREILRQIAAAGIRAPLQPPK